MQDGRTGAREGLSTVTQGTLILLIGTLGYVIENFVARVVLVRSLSLSQWSSFSLGLTTAGLLAAFGSLGIGAAIARTLPYTHSVPDRRQMIRTAFLIVTPAAVAIAVGLFLIGQLSPDRSVSGLPVTLEFLAVAAAFAILSGLIAAVFQGFERVSANALFVQILNPLIFLLALVAAYGLAGFQLNYLYALAAYTVAAAATLGALVLYAWIQLPGLLPSGPTPPGLSRKLVLFALPLFLVAILGYLTQNADTLTLGYFHRPEVGQYTASLSLARLLQVGIGSLGYIFLPVTTRFIRDRDQGAVRITYTTTTKWTILTSMPFFLLFFFLPTRSMAFVYGNPYAIDALPLEIVVLGSFLSTLVGPAPQGQVAFGRTTLLLVNTGAAALADIALALLLVPTYGITGAAIAWATANALLPVLCAVELAVLDGVHPFHPHYLLPLGLTVVPLGLLFLAVPFHPTLLLLPFLGLAVAVLYMGVVWASGSIDDGDRMLVEVVEGWIGRRIPIIHRLGRRRGPGGPPPAR